MAYELHVDRRHVATFPSLDEALTRAREMLLNQPDCEPEILDSDTKRAVEPASSRRWREELSQKVGF
jgi:hypothetical protein